MDKENKSLKSRRAFLKYGTLIPVLRYAPQVFLRDNHPDSRPAKFLKACTKGILENVKKLLRNNPNLLKSKDSLGRSGFALALLGGHQQIVKFLKTSGYLTDLHESVLDLDWDRYEILVGEESDNTAALINADHPIGGTVMWAAAAGGAGSNIWRVYAKCGDPNSNPRKAAGTTALQQAIQFPDLEIAELTAASLLSNHADPNPPQNIDPLPLHIATNRGSYELVEMLIRHGADVNVKDQKGKTPLQIAEKIGQKKVWELLNDHERVKRTCQTSRSAYTADGLVYQSPPIKDIPPYLQSRFVGNAHANLEYIKNEVNRDPRIAHSTATTSERSIEACAHTGRKNIVDYLLKHGAPYSLPTAVMLNDFETVKRLLDEDPNRIHERGAHDFALLWYPVIGQCDVDMAQLLLDRGAKVEEQHFLGTTALHWACRRGPIELIELLIENGADVNRIGRKFSAEGQSPLQMTKDEKIKDFLLSKGAN